MRELTADADETLTTSTTTTTGKKQRIDTFQFFFVAAARPATNGSQPKGTMRKVMKARTNGPLPIKSRKCEV